MDSVDTMESMPMETYVHYFEKSDGKPEPFRPMKKRGPVGLRRKKAKPHIRQREYFVSEERTENHE